MDADVVQIVTIVAFVFGLYEYHRAQVWKKAEFLASLIRDWEAQRPVRAVQKMLDYSSTRMAMQDYGGRTQHPEIITSDSLARALELPEQRRTDHRIGSAEYTPLEHDIRDFFDCFLDGIGRFQTYVRAQVVSEADFRPYLGYWFRRLGQDAVHDAGALRAIGSFAREFHPDAIEFLESAGVSFGGSRPPSRGEQA